MSFTVSENINPKELTQTKSNPEPQLIEVKDCHHVAALAAQFIDDLCGGTLTTEQFMGVYWEAYNSCH